MAAWNINTADSETHHLLASQRMGAVNQLAAGVAHEFNNVLQIVRGYVAVVQKTLPAETQSHEDLSHAVEATDRAAGLATRLLHFARAEDEPGVAADAAEAVHSLRMLLRPIIGENVRIEVDIEPDLPPVAVGDGSLRQALLNLCVNARDAMPDGGTLRLEASRHESVPGPFALGEPRREGPCVCIAVTDEGQGIPPELQQRLFEPFFTTKAPGKGTGLGLPMVASCVASAGGALRLTSTPGAGSCFEVYFPVAAELSNEGVAGR